MESKFRIAASIVLIACMVFGGCATSREQEIEDELSDFRTWVNRQANTLADKTEADWEQAKQDFERRTNELDQKQEHFTDELKQDYQQLKTEFEGLDEAYHRSREEARVAEWERKLLGRYADLASINETNVREVYTTFLENVRAMHENWSNQDWEMANLVMQKLNEQKEQIDDNLPTDDEVKIKALQIEFRALETVNDVGGN